jgi:hypothetical protein
METCCPVNYIIIDLWKCFCKLQGSKPKLRIIGSWNPPEFAAAISGHLKIVEVKCEVIDDKVIKVLKLHK